MPNVNNPSYQGYTPSFDDERRITDIVRNRNPISSSSNPFVINNAKVDYNNLSIYSNRKSAFDQRTHSDPKYNRPDFHGAFQSPFNDVNHLNFGSDQDNDLHSYKALSVHNGPFEVFSRPIFVYDEASKNRSPTDFGFWNAHDTTKHRIHHFDQHRHQEFHNVYKNPGIITKSKQNELDAGNYDFRKVSFRPTISNSYGFNNEARIPNKGFKDTSEFWNPELMTMFRDFGSKITEKSKCKYLNSFSLMISNLFLCHSFRCIQFAHNVLAFDAILTLRETETRISIFNEAYTRKTGDTNLRTLVTAVNIAYVRCNLNFFMQQSHDCMMCARAAFHKLIITLLRKTTLFCYINSFFEHRIE